MEESERMIGMKTWNEKRRENRAFFDALPRLLVKGEAARGQVLACFHQDQRLIADRHRRCALTRLMHGLRLCGNLRLHKGNLRRIRLHPLQTRLLRDLLQISQRQAV